LPAKNQSSSNYILEILKKNAFSQRRKRETCVSLVYFLYNILFLLLAGDGGEENFGNVPTTRATVSEILFFFFF
jgi:hypothetical protein